MEFPSQTAAGRADYHEKLISLNPRLVEHPRKSIARCVTSSLISSRNFAKKVGDGFHRTDPSGSRLVAIWESQDEKRCHTLPFPAKRYAPRFIYRCPNCRRDFLAYARSNAQSLVWPVAARITAASSMYVFG
jgi:predicted SprT family Zn-dependent metalloprotease